MILVMLQKGKKQHAFAYDGTANSRSSEQWKMDAQTAVASGKMVSWELFTCLLMSQFLGSYT